MAGQQFGLWAENWPAVEAFLTVSNQWRTTPLFGAPPHYTGLDYAACSAAWASAGIVMHPTLWDAFRVIEAGAQEALNSR